MLNHNSENYFSCHQSIVDQIINANDLISIYGKWPSFESAEIVSINMNRGNILECIHKNDWTKKYEPSLEVGFILLPPEGDEVSALNQRIVSYIIFDEIDDITLTGFNHQNPINGLGIRLINSDRLKKELFCVNWGGAALSHDVLLTCGKVVIKTACYLRD